TRYLAACIALLLMMILPLATITMVGLSAPDRAMIGLPPVSDAQPESQTLTVVIEPSSNPDEIAMRAASPQPWSSIRSKSLVPFLPWMILFWLLGVTFLSLRLVAGWLYTQRVKSHGTFLLEEKWQRALRRLCSQLRVMRPVRILESTMVKVPTVIGWL